MFELFLTAAETPTTCPKSGYVTADIDSRSGEGHVIFGGPLWPTTSAGELPTRQSVPEGQGQGHAGTVSTLSSMFSVGIETCPWTLRALPGRRTVYGNCQERTVGVILEEHALLTVQCRVA